MVTNTRFPTKEELADASNSWKLSKKGNRWLSQFGQTWVILPQKEHTKYSRYFSLFVSDSDGNSKIFSDYSLVDEVLYPNTGTNAGGYEAWVLFAARLNKLEGPINIDGCKFNSMSSRITKVLDVVKSGINNRQDADCLVQTLNHMDALLTPKAQLELFPKLKTELKSMFKLGHRYSILTNSNLQVWEKLVDVCKNNIEEHSQTDNISNKDADVLASLMICSDDMDDKFLLDAQMSFNRKLNKY